MADFWNFSTSVRNPERLPDFLKVAAKLEGKIWNDESQEKFQILLIQYRLYLDSDNTQSLNKLSEEQKSWLIDITNEMTFDEAQSIYRAKEIFGAKKIVIVTQKYHLYRALYIAESFKIQAYGVSSNLRKYYGQFKREIREVIARDKDFVKSKFKPKPKYLGEQISIHGNGDITNDK